MGFSPVLDFQAFVDDFSNSRLGYSFQASRHVGVHQGVRSGLLRHVLREERFRASMVSSVENGRIAWRREAAQAYLATCSKYVELTLLLIHLTSGMPARGTELETYHISNGVSSMRSLYYHEGHIFFFADYSKTRHKTIVSNGVARFLAKKSSRMVIVDLLLVRPFVCLLAQNIGVDPSRIYAFDYFVVSGRSTHEQQGHSKDLCQAVFKLLGFFCLFSPVSPGCQVLCEHSEDPQGVPRHGRGRSARRWV